MANLKDLLVNGPSRFIGDVNITGIPTAPTAAVGTNSTQIATTAFIKNTIDSLNLGNARIYYGVCGTAAATAQKEVTCEAYTTTGDPIAGDIIYVAFNVTNSAAVADLTLKVNQSTAKGIRYQRTPQVSTLPSAEYLSASNVYRFVYNGTYWVTVLDTNTDSLLKVYTRTSGYSGDYPILVGSTLASALMGKSNNSTTAVYGIIYKQKAPTVNPATGLLKIPGSLTVGTSGDTNTTLQVYGTTSLSGNFCPSTSGIYDLGSNSLQWKDIYGNLMGNAETTTAADLTTTVNAIAYYNDTAGTFASKPSADGALYATSANGTLQWGTLPVGQGGTGATSFTANKLLYYNGTNLSSASNIHFDGSALIINGNTLWASEDSFEILEGSAYFAEDIYVDGDINGDLIGNVSGNAGSATKLQTARSLQVNLASTAAITFNGTADVNNIPISGTLGIDHGGTGATSFQSNKLIYCNNNNQLTTSFLKINTGSASNAFESSQLVIANTTASMGIEIRKQSNASGFHSSWQILSDNTSLDQNTNVLKLRTNSVGTNNGTYDTDIVDFNYYKVTFYKDIYGTLKGNADTATGANLTTVTNAIAYYSNTTGTFASKSSADGALYATSAGGELQWGTLPVNQGGTGNNIALTQYRPIFASTTSQMAACTNIYMNNTSLAVNVPNNSPTITSGYNFEVNGKSKFTDIVNIANVSTSASNALSSSQLIIYGSQNIMGLEIDKEAGETGEHSSWQIINDNTGATFNTNVLKIRTNNANNGTYNTDVISFNYNKILAYQNINLEENKQISRTATGSYYWYDGRNKALIYSPFKENYYNPAISIKTKNGSWNIAANTGNTYLDKLLFTYYPDSKINNSSYAPPNHILFESNRISLVKTGYDTSIGYRIKNQMNDVSFELTSGNSSYVALIDNSTNNVALWTDLTDKVATRLDFQAKGYLPGWTYTNGSSITITDTNSIYLLKYSDWTSALREGIYQITVTCVGRTVSGGNNSGSTTNTLVYWGGIVPWVSSSHHWGYTNAYLVGSNQYVTFTTANFQLRYYFSNSSFGSTLSLIPLSSHNGSTTTFDANKIQITMSYIAPFITS